MDAIPTDIAKKINKDAADIIRRSVEKRILASFEEVKSEIINEFLMHPVTQEIKNGPSSSNISGTLNGYGNLFSYIGFYDGDDPISPILEELRKSKMVFSGLIEGGAVWTAFIPAKQDIWDVSEMPWATGRSWAKGIETGISGVGYYLYNERKKLQNSRSGTAIQTATKMVRPRFKNVKYISEILAKFEKKISKLNEASIST